MKKILERIWPSIGWTLVIFILLAMPTSGVDGSGLFNIPHFDKVIHFGLFLVLSFFWGVFFSHKKSGNQHTILLLIVVLGSGFGLGMEFYQKFFTLRSFSYLDAVADAAGAVVGVWAVKKSPYGNRGRNQN
jgi:hypothetical protein